MERESVSYTHLLIMVDTLKSLVQSMTSSSLPNKHNKVGDDLFRALLLLFDVSNILLHHAEKRMLCTWADKLEQTALLTLIMLSLLLKIIWFLHNKKLFSAYSSHFGNPFCSVVVLLHIWLIYFKFRDHNFQKKCEIQVMVYEGGTQ